MSEADTTVAPDEAALVRAAKADPQAFGELYKRHLGRIYGYLRARSPTREEAEDLAEQVFLKAYQSLPAYRERGLPFHAWLFRIAHNVVTDAHRRRRDHASWDTLLPSEHPHDLEDPEALALRAEEAGRVRALVDRLPAERRQIIWLRFGAELTLREIAATIGKSEPTVHRQLRLALETLKELAREG